MAEINIKITEINDAIAKLQALKSTCTSINVAAPKTIGGGQSINEIESIANVYKIMFADFGKLISDTISFLQNVRDSYIASDTFAAN